MMQASILAAALVTAAFSKEAVSAHWSSGTTTTDDDSCESYAEKYDSVIWNSTLLRQNDPCFGYTKTCCTEDSSAGAGHCSWKTSFWCTTSATCTANDGDDCPACCESDNLTMEPTGSPTEDPTKEPTDSPSKEPTDSPSKEPTVSPSKEPTDSPSKEPTPKPTTTTTEEVATPSPTMHSAKKWEMLHPDYQGGDGELLWNVYYGDFADDERFNAFRADQLWNADVIRPIVEMDVKYERFQLNHEALNAPRHSGQSASFRMANYQWAVLAVIAVAIVAAFGAWYKRSRPYSKVMGAAVDETEPLNNYGSARQ